MKQMKGISSFSSASMRKHIYKEKKERKIFNEKSRVDTFRYFIFMTFLPFPIIHLIILNIKFYLKKL